MRTGVLAGNHNAPRGRRDGRFSTLLRRRGCTRCVRRIARTVTPRGTDWSLALLVALGLGTGLATWFAGSPQQRLGVRRARGRRRRARARARLEAAARVAAHRGALAVDGRTGLRPRRRSASSSPCSGAAARGPTASMVGSPGCRCSAGTCSRGRSSAASCSCTRSGGRGRCAALDAADRRQFVAAAFVGAAAVGAWALQRPACSGRSACRGACRRFTGSYDAGSVHGSYFPVTSWVAERSATASRERVPVGGGRRGPAPAVPPPRTPSTAATRSSRRSTARAASRRRSAGAASGSAACSTTRGLAPAGAHVRVVRSRAIAGASRLADARDLVLATHVSGEPLYARPRRALFLRYIFLITAFYLPGSEPLCPAFIKSKQPRLVILGIMVDGLCNKGTWNLLWNYFDPNGFKKIISQGANCRNVSYTIVSAGNASDIASIMTGSVPYYNGVVGSRPFLGSW